MAAPLWSAHALLDDPSLVTAIHRDYLIAGAQVITTDSFRTHARNLAEAGLQREADRLTRLTAMLARAARTEQPMGMSHADVPRARIAGSISPLEDCWAPDRSPALQRARIEHESMASALFEGGCEVFLIETMGKVDEACAAVDATRSFGIPTWLSVTTDEAGHLLGGESFEDLLAGLRGLTLQALLVNCIELARLPASMAALASASRWRGDLALGAYPNAGRSTSSGYRQSAMNEMELVDVLRDVVARHDEIVMLGSCCGSTPAWTRALRVAFHGSPEQREAGFVWLDRNVPLRLGSN